MFIESSTTVGVGRLRVAAVFAVATLLPLAVLLVVVPLVGAWGGFVGSSVRRPLAMVLVACVVGGQWAGGRVGRGVRLRVAFGVAFPIALMIPLLTVAGLESLSGHETIVGLARWLVPAFVVAYSLLGVVGGVLSGRPSRHTVQVAGMCAGGGVVGGMVLAGVVVGTVGLPATVAGVVRACGAVIACALPAAVGGWGLAMPRLGWSDD